MTVGELRRKLEALKNQDVPVVVQITEGDSGYTKAYATSTAHVHDCLPDGQGGDDIHNAGFVLVIEAELKEVA